jgi:hypothetical protein
MKKTLKFISINLMLLIPCQAIAWGAAGHKLIVDMALSLLTPQAKQNVIKALGANFTPESAAVWMDVVRGTHDPNYTYMKNWHFVDMNADQNYAQVANKNDVVYNLQRMIAFFSHIPSGVSQDSIQTNLRILFHLMGDITQPLHVGYGYDGGGNSDPVTTPIYNQTGNNLHHVWDDIIILDGHINLQTCQAFYHALNPATLGTVTQGTTQDWLVQARAYLPEIYAPNPTMNATTALTKAYLDSNVQVVQQQLVYAAVRLAAVLQQTYGS